MSYERQVKSLFNEWAIEDGAVDMAREHWARVEPVLSALKPSAGRYLEVGPGNGYALEYIARQKFAKGQAHAVELSEEMAKLSRAKTKNLRNVEIEVASFLSWSAPKGEKYDLIFSMEVFYYFEDIAAAICKAADLLAPDGELIIMVDYYEEAEESRGWDDELGVKLTRWPKQRYAQAFEAAGLLQVNQTIQIGGVQEHGLTLCTRGRKPSTPAHG